MASRPITVTPEDEREFLDAMERYKRGSGRQFPTWSEILEVLRSLGYAKRVWRPVGPWSPMPPATVGEAPLVEDSPGLIGWFASVETQASP